MLDVAQNIPRHDALERDVIVSPAANRVVGLRDIVDLVRRRASFIAWFVFVCVVVLCLGLAAMQSTYTATSMLVLERNESRMLETVTQLDGKERSQGADRDRAAIETEMDLITSRVFAGKVVDAMGLVKDPWFNPYLRTNTTSKRSAAAQRDASITSLLAATWVTRSGESLVVSVHIRNPDPERAAAIANKAADIYVEWSRELKLKAMAQAVSFLRERGRQVAIASNLGRHHPDVVKTEAEVETVHSMVESEAARLIEEAKNPKPPPAPNETSPDAAAADRALAEMKLRHLERNLLADKKLYDLVAGRIDNQAEIASPSARVVSAAAVPTTASFPQTQRILAAGLVGSLVLAILFALVLEALDTRIRDSRRIEQLVQLPNLVEFPRSSSVDAGGERRWLSVADRVRKPFGIASVLRRMVSLGGYVFRSNPRATVSRKASIAYTVKSELAAPFASSAPLRLTSADQLSAGRGLYLVCRGRISAAKPAVLFAAPMPDNGNSSVAVGFAIAAAQDGLSTVLLDLDPSGETALALSGKRRRCIEDVIDGVYTLAESLQTVPGYRGLHYIASRSIEDENAAPIKSGSMHALLKQLRGPIDIIVIESGPVLVRETANWLAPLVDATLLVAQAGKTTEQQLLDASMSLKANRAPLIGTVLTGTARRRDRILPSLSEVRQGVGGFFSTDAPKERSDAGSSA